MQKREEDKWMLIAIDMDGTIANWTKLAIENSKRFFNLDIDIKNVDKPKFSDVITDSQIYSLICDGDFYENLEPFDGAIATVKKIYDMGHTIVFLTKPTNWSSSSSQKTKWLNKYFNDINYSVIMVSTMEAKKFINAHIIVDDDPRALTNHPTAIPICPAQPWNKTFRDAEEIGMVVLDSIEELPEHVDRIDNLLKDEHDDALNWSMA